jgi:hypothetical protein
MSFGESVISAGYIQLSRWTYMLEEIMEFHHGNYVGRI